MKFINKIVDLLHTNKLLLVSLVLQKYGCFIPDSLYLRWIFYCRMGYKLNLKNPRSFSEKLQWLKINNRKEIYTSIVDKFEVKQYIADRIGDSFVIPTLGVWDTCEEIDWKKLPLQFVLKTTHGGGGSGVIVCKDKNSLDQEETVCQLSKALKHNIYTEFREWPYKNIKPRIIAEKYMTQEDGSSLIDYKFFCFNGQPKFLYVRNSGPHPSINYMTMDWKPVPFKRSDCLPSDILPIKPLTFEEMEVIASKLSQDFPFVRVDLYEICGHVYFSELTFYPSSGLLPFEPQEWDFKIGKLLSLTNNN